VGVHWLASTRDEFSTQRVSPAVYAGVYFPRVCLAGFRWSASATDAESRRRYHHAAFEGNYGANCGILLVDHILGTSKNYEKWLMKYRQAHTNGQIDRTQAAKDIAELEIASEEQAI